MLSMDLQKVFLLVIGTAIIRESMAHIRLVYPPARKFADIFDFYDNIRSPGPCGGMAKGLGNVTNLQAGSTLQIHWHLGAIHLGGFFVELLNSNNAVINRFPNDSNVFFSNDTYAQNMTITLPNQNCSQCTLRMRRQANDLNTATNTFAFWSCADINIKSTAGQNDKCSGFTTNASGQCACGRLFKGENCQFKDDCDTDADCNNHGTCLDVVTKSFPRKQCYCQPGYFGTLCQLTSSVKDRPTNLALYQRKEVNGDVTLYYRILKDIGEVEMMMEVKTLSWLGIGWRPSNTNTACTNFPNMTAGASTIEPTTAPPLPQNADGNLHPMYCNDMVIASAKGNLSKVGDFYTRDLATPIPDEFLGGTNSLTAAMAWEENGTNSTVMLFRKKLTATEKMDHGLLDELTPVVWAFGQNPNSLGPNGTSPGGFHVPDELKFHGKITTQRGSVAVNFYNEGDGGNCDSCGESKCGLDFSWRLDTSSDEVTFSISAKGLSATQWIALGFSSDRQMPDTDVIYGGQLSNGTFIIRDGYLSQRAPPSVSENQDAKLLSGRYENGVTSMTFSRKRNTGDSKDFIFSDSNCYFVFFAKGGAIDGSTGIISQHANVPSISGDKICFKKCEGTTSTSTLPTSTLPISTLLTSTLLTSTLLTSTLLTSTGSTLATLSAAIVCGVCFLSAVFDILTV